MASIIKTTANDGSTIEFVDEIIGSGGIKDAYFSPDKSYVVLFYRSLKPNSVEYKATKERLEMIVGRYRESIFLREGGQYWNDFYNWPQKIVEYNEKIGIIVATYPACYFFAYGSKNDDMLGIKGKEKQGKWFASAYNRNGFLDIRERGTLLSYLRICLRISRAIRRMHMAGLAHSDLSYSNVLIDPHGGSAMISDIDNLVVPGKYAPEVIGTPDFIAPEVLKTQHLAKDDRKRVMPSRLTDQHALAVLIYMYLLYRHPLRGKKVHDINDAIRDELLSMGEYATFIEHPTDYSNRPNSNDARKYDLPWINVDTIPYKILGPYLKKLFDEAFIHGLHNPMMRPTADDWENALVKTVDLIQPCQNIQCEQKWFIFDNTSKPKCPYCNTPYTGILPVLDFYSLKKVNVYSSDNHKLMVYNGQNIYLWHAHKTIFPNEKLSDEQRIPIADFQVINKRWYLINRRLPSMLDKSEDRPIPINSAVEISNGKKILLSSEIDGRLLIVTMINN